MTLEKMTPEQAIEYVVGRRTSRGKTRLEALHVTAGYLNHDWLTVEGVRIACHKGCSACCNQTIVIGGFEGDLILKWIRSQPRRQQNQILERMYERIRQFKAWAQEQGVLDWLESGLRLRVRRQEDLQEVSRLIELLLPHQEPCIVLSEQGFCSIYPVRPMVCRTARATSVCSSASEGEIIRTPYDPILESKVFELEELPWSDHEGRDSLPLPLVMEFTLPEEEWLASQSG
jgi:Fe-S-cluster containining protein